jgi:trans-aconitate methyltransferase
VLGEAFRVEGLDVDPGMVDIARAKHPDVPIHVADMVDFDLGRRFDVARRASARAGPRTRREG